MSSEEFTGERYIPGQGGAQIAYEHLHRYLFASRWVKDKRVLDVAAGTGYGAEILSQSATQVWAVDIDAGAVAQARRTRGRPNLNYVQGDATSLPFQSCSMDVVVALEVLEHVHTPEELVRDVARIVRPDGAVLISTPNKAVYSDARNYSNPFHVREFYRDEFSALLRLHFEHVILMNQQVRAGSLIITENSASQEVEVLARVLPNENRRASDPMYLLALCSRRKPAATAPAVSAYLDLSDYLQEEWRDKVEELTREIEMLGRWGKDLEAIVQRKEEAMRHVLLEVDQRDRTIRQLQEEMRHEISRRDQALDQLRKEFDDRTRWALTLQKDLSDRDETLSQKMEELQHLASHMSRIRHALVYRVLCRVGFLPE